MEVAGFVMIGVVWIAFFTWLAVIGWAIQRRKERVAYYRQETEKKLIDKGTMTADQILRLRSEDERAQWLRRREGLRLGGLITAALGVGVLVCLEFIDTGEVSVTSIGWVPLAIGVVLLLYAYVLCPKFTEPDRDALPPSPSEQRDNQHY